MALPLMGESGTGPSYDLCIVGHLTRDTIRAGGEEREAPGGTVLYTGVAAAGLGLKVLAITKLAAADRADLIEPLAEAGIDVICRDSRETTRFVNEYAGGADEREQHVPALADAFVPSDLPPLDCAAVHLGPLMPDDMAPDFVAAASRAAGGARLSLDLQGYVRGTDTSGRVIQAAVPAWADAASHVDMIKADDHEACAVTGLTDPGAAADRIRAAGPREVAVTLASRGSIIHDGTAHEIPPYPPGVDDPDATGCGDTYVAGYLFARMKGRSVIAAAHFAAALSALKMRGSGPCRISARDVDSFIAAHGGPVP